MKRRTPLFTPGLISMELLTVMSLQTQVAARNRLPDHALVLLRPLRALERHVLLGNNAIMHLNPSFCDRVPPKQGMQILPVCIRPSDSYCDSPVSSSVFPPPSEPIALTPLILNLRSK